MLPAALNGLTASFGWFIVNSVSGACGIQPLFPSFKLPFWLAFLVVVVAEVLIAALGHNLIHVFERLVVPLLGIVFIIACFYIFINGDYGYTPKPVPGGWLLAFTAAFGYAVGWNPFAADYTRYLPPTVNRRMVGFWAGFGVLLSCVVLEMAGAVLATVAKTDFFNGIPTAQLQKAMPDPVYYAALLCIAIGAAAADALDNETPPMALLSPRLRGSGMTLGQRRGRVTLGSRRRGGRGRVARRGH